MRMQQVGQKAAVASLFFFAASSFAFASQGGWQVNKVTGEVWISSSGAQKISLTNETVVQAGDGIRTGKNGRVLLARGEEMIMISPNSEIAIPQSSKDGMETTIAQRSGSATFEVEKRNVQHFKVETPYLAAVVKGTRFQVSVNGSSARVNVARGAVDVSDFKSGQHALIMPGQAARVSAVGSRGLSITGQGPHSPILRGGSRAPSVSPDGRALRGASLRGTQTGHRSAESARFGNSDLDKPGTRISAPVGEMKLDYAKVTNGLAGSTDASAPGLARSNGNQSQPGMTNSNTQSASAGAIASGSAGGGTAAAASGGGGGGSSGSAGGGGGGSAAAAVVSGSTSSGGSSGGGLIGGILNPAGHLVGGVARGLLGR